MQGRIALLAIRTPSEVIRSEGWTGCIAAVMLTNTEFLFNDDWFQVDTRWYNGIAFFFTMRMREETRLV